MEPKGQNRTISVLIQLFLEKIIPKYKKLFLGIKSGGEGSEVELFWARFSYF